MYIGGNCDLMKNTPVVEQSMQNIVSLIEIGHLFLLAATLSIWRNERRLTGEEDAIRRHRWERLALQNRHRSVHGMSALVAGGCVRHCVWHLSLPFRERSGES
jgi:hypothetical protein